MFTARIGAERGALALAHDPKDTPAADERLMEFALTCAILRPVALTNDGRGALDIPGENVDMSAKASRADGPMFWPRPPPQNASTAWRRICNPSGIATVSFVKMIEHPEISGIWYS